MVDYSHQVNEAGLDAILNNARMRATSSGFTPSQGVLWMCGAGTPISSAPGATVTITAANLLTGIITYAPSVANTATFDTAANLLAAFNAASTGAQIGDYIECLIINGSATNAITLAAGSGNGFDGNNANTTIAAATSRYVIIRFTNVTTAACTIYF